MSGGEMGDMEDGLGEAGCYGTPGERGPAGEPLSLEAIWGAALSPAGAEAAGADEPALIARARHEPEAFGDLYRRYVQRIYNYHYRHTGNVGDAEDLTSRTFYRALRSIDSYKDKGNTFQAWLFRIAHNLLVNWYRDEGRRRVVSLDTPAGETYTQSSGRLHDEPHEKVVQSEQQGWLARLLDTLPEDRKTLLILKFVEKMSNEEIAKVLGKTEGAIKSLYHRTLSDLRESIEQGDLAGELL